MIRIVRIACAIKVAMLARQTRFEHLEDALIPRRNFIAIRILKRRALDTRNVLFVVRAQHIDLLPKQLHKAACLACAYHAYQLTAPYAAHRFQHVAFQRAHRIAQHDD